jgi:hypothetical protein
MMEANRTLLPFVTSRDKSEILLRLGFEPDVMGIGDGNGVGAVDMEAVGMEAVLGSATRAVLCDVATLRDGMVPGFACAKGPSGVRGSSFGIILQADTWTTGFSATCGYACSLNFLILY